MPVKVSFMNDSPKAPASGSLLITLMPGVFVFLWSTGFIGAKLGLPYVEPMTFLSWRFAIVAALMLLLAMVTGAPWPKDLKMVVHIAIAGVMLQAVYLGGVFASISLGVPAGVSALIVGVQPILTAIAAGPFLGEKVSRRQWLGFLLGLIGVTLVVWNKLGLGAGTPFAMGLSVIALFGITGGTLYQKKFCPNLDLRTGGVIQFAVSAVVLLAIAWSIESMQIIWSGEFIFALAWLCIVMSFGAISLLFILIRHGEAARVASLFYMVPPSTALIAFFLFGETLDEMALGGMALAVIGVALVNMKRSA
jgi:drug/metabolite transporter (DMT)-like permease